MTFVRVADNALFVKQMKFENKLLYLELIQIAKCVLKMKYLFGLVI